MTDILTATIGRSTFPCPSCGQPATVIGPELHGIDVADLPSGDGPFTLAEAEPCDPPTIHCPTCGSNGECRSCAEPMVLRFAPMPPFDGKEHSQPAPTLACLTCP